MYVCAVCISRALVGGLGETGVTSHTMSSPVGCNDLTAIWVAGSTRGE